MSVDYELILLTVKIGVALFSMVTLYIFRRDILKIITDITVGGDTKEYVGKDISEIKERLNDRINEVLK